jgi:hypothetical protein
VEKERDWRRKGTGEEKGLEKERDWRRKGAGEGKAANSGYCPNINSVTDLSSCSSEVFKKNYHLQFSFPTPDKYDPPKHAKQSKYELMSPLPVTSILKHSFLFSFTCR